MGEPLVPEARGTTPLPELNWADRQELWDLMVKKESGMYKRPGAELILNRHTSLQPKMRAILLGRIMDLDPSKIMHIGSATHCREYPQNTTYSLFDCFGLVCIVCIFIL